MATFSFIFTHRFSCTAKCAAHHQWKLTWCRKKRKTSLDVFMCSLPSTNMNWHKSKCSLGWAFKTDLCDVVLCSVWLQKLVEMMILFARVYRLSVHDFSSTLRLRLDSNFSNHQQQHDIKNYILQFTTKKTVVSHASCSHISRSCRVIISPSTFIPPFSFLIFQLKTSSYYTHLEHATWKLWLDNFLLCSWRLEIRKM